MAFHKRSTAEQVTDGVDLSGKVALVTGCNSGIGQETARVLASRGAHVIGTARLLSSATQACDDMSGQLTPIACELTDHQSIRAAATSINSKFDSLDIVVCNAGIMALPKFETVHGIEKQFMTNHIGHFLLVNLLMDTILQSDAARIVNVSSSAHFQAPKQGIDFQNLNQAAGYSAFRAYGRSKLANILFTQALASQFKGTAHTANALHPGVIATNLGRHMNPLLRVAFGLFGAWFLKSVAQGAATSCYLAAHPDLDGVSGQYYADCKPARSLAIGRDQKLVKQLWQESEQITDEIAET